MKTTTQAALAAALSAWMAASAQATPAPLAMESLAGAPCVMQADNPCGPSNPCGPGKKKKKKGSDNPCGPGK
jgi:hypothetical protein